MAETRKNMMEFKKRAIRISSAAVTKAAESLGISSNMLDGGKNTPRIAINGGGTAAECVQAEFPDKRLYRVFNLGMNR
ncbi:hypothetical protein CAFE_11720 [Caprobacter fermentans]|uniref:Uncharacterized protein n=1 Tax=Caproicibacter fermentans TaxID=2576756 RepID=A0A6N8HXK3_9FIRM|nr:hypothetical protein [Caproicibacter fermentans]MVB10482.1 hypothetical protein [Caproicibacter fermentans]OCN00740.1 hypothetical protein A7X67_08160 [Clostridium sp. W14A]QNK41681.1 hypothetical protein HCR03_05355 [Caproicibacter fermentans]